MARPNRTGRPLAAHQENGLIVSSAPNATVRIAPVAGISWSLADLPGELASRIVVSDGPCPWLGTEPHTRDGYARWGQTVLHRAVWAELVGDVPDGLVLDHVRRRGCVSRACCWPGHLEPVTNRVNILRGRSFSAVNFLKTRCGSCGAPYDLFNTYWKPGGGRDCRACIRRRTREYKARQLAADLGLAA